MPAGANWARKVGARGSRRFPKDQPRRPGPPPEKAAPRKSGLRGFIAKTKEVIARGRAQAKAKDAEPDTEKKWKVEGEAGIAYDGRFEREAETFAKAAAEKTWWRDEKRGLYYGDDGANLTVGKASGSFSSGVEYDFKEGTGTIAAVKLEGSAAILEAQAEKEVAGGLLKGSAKGEALSVAGTADLLSFSRDKKGRIEATLADVGVEANLVKGEIGGEIAITPRTIYDNFIGPVVGLFGGKAKLSEDSKWADHGLVVGGKAEAGIGAAAKASAKYADGKFQVGSKAGAGPMAGLAFSIGVK